jgi:hypothetical protein
MSTPTEHLDALFALASDALVQRCSCDDGRVIDLSAQSEPFKVGDRIAWSCPMVVSRLATDAEIIAAAHEHVNRPGLRAARDEPILLLLKPHDDESADF